MTTCCEAMEYALQAGQRPYRGSWVEAPPHADPAWGSGVYLVCRSVDQEHEAQFCPSPGMVIPVLSRLEIHFCPWCGRAVNASGETGGAAILPRRLAEWWRGSRPCCPAMADHRRPELRARRGFWVEAPPHADPDRFGLVYLTCRSVDADDACRPDFGPFNADLSLTLTMVVPYCVWCGSRQPQPRWGRWAFSPQAWRYFRPTFARIAAGVVGSSESSRVGGWWIGRWCAEEQAYSSFSLWSFHC